MTDQLHIRRAALLGALSLTILLAACGGGGGGGGSPATGVTSQPTSSPTPTSTSGTNGTLATPQYAAGSQELAAFNQLNAMRQQCGFPALKENTLLDTSTVNHVQYMIDNSYVGHYEVAGNPGFTGTAPQSRAQYVGYTGSVGEVLDSVSTGSGGSYALLQLSSAPYHLAGLFSPSTDIGMKYGALNSTYDGHLELPDF